MKSLYPVIRSILKNELPDYWYSFQYIFSEFLEEPIIPEVILPLASCKAVNGEVMEAAYVAAALVAAATSLRILDDLEDQDRPQALWNHLGAARTWNYVSALQTLSFDILSKASLAPDKFHKINRCFIETFLRIASGQDRDLAGNTQTVEDYWLTVEQKIACAYAASCVVGAMVGTDNAELIQSCRMFGHHLGFAIQIFNDLESIWCPDGITDLKQGKVTLPLLYGLTTNHPERDELNSLVVGHEISSNAERIKEILDRIDTRGFMIWAALKEREQALEAIAICPNREGKEVLEAYITGMFGDIDSLLPAKKPN